MKIHLPFQAARGGPLVKAMADGVIPFAIGAGHADIGQGAGVHPTVFMVLLLADEWPSA